MKVRDVDTLMSILAVVFVVATFIFTAHEARDIVLIGVFVATPTKFISVARMLDIVKGGKDG
jgi:hypothetical protein